MAIPSFSRTIIESNEGNLRLCDIDSGAILVEVKRSQFEDNVRAGFIDPNNLHFSLWEYAKIKSIAPSTKGHSDSVFLRSLGISPD